MIRNDVIKTSLPKQRHNSNLCETKEIRYHSEDFDKSFPKIYVLSNLSRCVKSYGHLNA